MHIKDAYSKGIKDEQFFRELRGWFRQKGEKAPAAASIMKAVENLKSIIGSIPDYDDTLLAIKNLQKLGKNPGDKEALEVLKGIIDKEIELIKADANMISFNSDVAPVVKESGIDRLNDERAEVEKQKLQIAREKNILDAMNKAEDRRVKEKDIDTKLKIARENKNRYDIGKKASTKK